MTRARTIVAIFIVLLFLAVGGIVAAFGGSNADNSGSIANPVPLGQQAQVGSWKIAFAGPLSEASQPVLSASGLSQPPSGTRYYAVTITATDAEPKALWFSATYVFIGAHGNVFYPAAVTSSGAKTDLDAYPGDVVQVTLVLSVPEDQAPRSKIQVTGLDDGQAMFFSTR